MSEDSDYEFPIDEIVEEQNYTSKFKLNTFKLSWKIQDFKFVCKTVKKMESPRFPSKSLKKGQWFIELQPTEIKFANSEEFKIFLKSEDNINTRSRATITFLSSSKLICRTYVDDGVLAFRPIREWADSGSDLYHLFNKQIPESLLVKCKLTVFDSVQTIRENSLVNSVKCNLMERIAELFDNENFKDVRFKLEDEEFTAHKAILAVRSPVFAAMFNSKMSEELTSVVEINDIKPTVFQQMLRFIYSDQVENLKQSASELIYVAEKYQVKELKIICINSLHENLSSKTVINTLKTADLYSVSKLKIECLKLLSAEWKTVKETEEFKNLIQNRPDLLSEIVGMQETTHHGETDDKNPNEINFTFRN